jgi:hypothetical protein
MNGPPTEIETRQLAELIQAIDDLRRRVAALESQSLPATASVAPPMEFATTLSPPDSTGLLATLGRLLLGIAGAYLLRAITEAALLPQLAGTLAGLVYAAAWLVSAARVTSANRLVAAFEALTAALIACPLVWEATIRFHTLTPAGAAAALALFIILGQVVAWRRDRDVIAGVAVFAGSATALVLMVATLNPVPFAMAVLVAAATIEYGAFRDHALPLRWMIALTADFCGFLLIYVATRPQGLPDGYAPAPIPLVIAIQIALAAIYAASTLARTLGRGLPIAWFEIAQVAISIALAIACGLRVAHGSGLVAMSAVCLAVGVCGYVVAFGIKTIPGRSFHAYAVFGVLMVSFGCLLIFPTMILTTLWCILGLAATAFGEYTRFNTLRMHGAFYLVAAAAASGLLAYSTGTMTGDFYQGTPPLTAPGVVCAISAALAYGLVLRLRRSRLPLSMERVPAAILAALACWSMVGLIAGWMTATGLDASLMSTLRTGLIASAAIGLAWFGSRRNLRELIWILYPWMIFGSLKLFAEDFRQGRPVTLFLSLLLYGGTLIALPRLLRRAPPARLDLS